MTDEKVSWGGGVFIRHYEDGESKALSRSLGRNYRQRHNSLPERVRKSTGCEWHLQSRLLDRKEPGKRMRTRVS